MVTSFINISYFDVLKIARQNILGAMRYTAQKYAKGDLIDIGCGEKPYKPIFDSYVTKFYGVDYAPSAEVNYGENTVADLYADCTQIPLPSESFDTVLSNQVMEHVYDTKKYLGEAFRLLKKDGYGIFTVPMTWQLHAEPFDFYRFTKHSLKQLFEDEGFTVVELKPLEGAYATLIQTKIVSFWLPIFRSKNLFVRFCYIFFRIFHVPVLNFLALKLDRFFSNDKLCLTYLIVVQK